jgi:hypothetical protein
MFSLQQNWIKRAEQVLPRSGGNDVGRWGRWHKQCKSKNNKRRKEKKGKFMRKKIREQEGTIGHVWQQWKEKLWGKNVGG